MPDLLLELFSEEIPARMQAKAADDLKRLVTNGLVDAGITYETAGAFATPRRLTLTVTGVLGQSPDQVETRRGPKIGAPDVAIDGFLRGTGLTKDQLQIRTEKKGEFYFARIEKPGRAAADVIGDIMPDIIRNFPWPKSMRWGAGKLRWVRPLHSILCILNDEEGPEIVPFSVEGFTASNTTQGHRFMGKGRFSVANFDDYRAKLLDNHVVLCAQNRADHIWQEATTLAFAQGLEVIEDAALLAEIAGLVEWPVVLMGDIEDRFLDLPPEVLQSSMREHQKFFSVKNTQTGRIEKFITVANRITADHGQLILAGYQKVLAARLSDAVFFWANDLRIAKSGMAQWLENLNNVTFERRLGSQATRINRIEGLAKDFADLVGAPKADVQTAARIAKADLNSEMVYEFPELQGVMGGYYARAAGHCDAIAAAAKDHYSPLGPSDDVPTAPISVAVALADKIDLLTGFWAIDEKPTGSKDPFALRRAALGGIRLILENDLRVDLGRFFDMQFARYAVQLGVDVTDAVKTDLLSFFHDRLKVHLRDEGIAHDVIDAALSKPPIDDVALIVARARALQAFLASDDGENLVQGYRRAANILAQAEDKDGVQYRFGADKKFADTQQEQALFDALSDAKAAIAPLIAQEKFADAMAEMAKLRAPIDAFFDAVQVNSDNDILRRNRLNLLYQIVETCGNVADLSRLTGA
jgi:glycyl-tRNA synthetase beta chain